MKDTLFLRIVEGQIDYEVMFWYEADYEYQVFDQEYFEKKTGGEVPEEVLDDTMRMGIVNAFQQVYPDGMRLSEVNRPDQVKLTKALTATVNEIWNEYFGISLSDFSLRSFRGDSSQMQQVMQMAQMQKMLMTQNVYTEKLSKIVCPYCDSVVCLTNEGYCPSCHALLKN